MEIPRTPSEGYRLKPYDRDGCRHGQAYLCSFRSNEGREIIELAIWNGMLGAWILERSQFNDQLKVEVTTESRAPEFYNEFKELTQ